MDILDHLIALAQVHGRADTLCHLQGNWYIPHQQRQSQALVHIATSGEGWVKIKGESTARKIGSGDVLFFPRLAEHILSSENDCANIHDTPQNNPNGAFNLKTRHDTGNRHLELFCARFTYEPHTELLKDLPELIVLNINQSALSNLVALLAYEAESLHSGASTAIDALSSMILLYLMRAYFQQNTPPEKGIWASRHDKRLYHLITNIVESPEKNWTVETLSATANVSRAHLMLLFKKHIQTSPHQFVTSIRLQKAALLLRQSQDSVLSIALSVGFQSENHFGKAFKKHYGQTPGQYRKSTPNKEKLTIETDYII